MYGNIRTVERIKLQSFLVGDFFGYSKCLNHFPSIYKPTQEIHDKQLPKYGF